MSRSRKPFRYQQRVPIVHPKDSKAGQLLIRLLAPGEEIVTIWPARTSFEAEMLATLELLRRGGWRIDAVNCGLEGLHAIQRCRLVARDWKRKFAKLFYGLK